MCVRVRTRMCTRVCGDQTTAYGNQFSPTLWVLELGPEFSGVEGGIQFLSPDLHVCPHTHIHVQTHPINKQVKKRKEKKKSLNLQSPKGVAAGPTHFYRVSQAPLWDQAFDKQERETHANLQQH